MVPLKKGESLLGPIEKRFVSTLGRHHTKMAGNLSPNHDDHSLVCLVILSAWQVRETGCINWFWGVSIAVVLQYLTDLFDGAVGRARNTGLVKWGFYMDHFLDFIFQCALIVAYALISPPELNLQWWFFAILAITSGFMVNSFLSFAATNEFEIYFLGIGPTEIRIYFIALNTVIIYLDPTRQYFETLIYAFVGNHTKYGK